MTTVADIIDGSTDYPPRLVMGKWSNRTSKTNVVLLRNATFTGYNAYVAVTSNTFSVAAFHNCSRGVQTTSKQAKHHSCQVATNGGPFQSYRNGGCTGEVIIGGKVVSGEFSSLSSVVGFGVTNDNRWLFGRLANEIEAQQLGINYFVTGFGWLVYNGLNALTSNKTESNMETLSSARTAVGVDHEGRLVLLVVDGCEKCFERKYKGSTLQELAALLVRMGVKHAINLDGGGSSTFVYNGKTINKPTCLDIPYRCERPVTTVMCIKR
eukprot:CAMPEP_0195308146 /NCGR_PEP_ID=MMETSP0707-20130614/38075_1 /TAXON_ID=33640 /ORGANISM="Asterionellopsis glacialis, Strain CCMP134" /LENGTH=266 /DNA_ID=CAMNT_0040372405 /DNA_START=336 /DNA_END=1136 /DNA_ORIENTATION=-